MKRIAFIVLTLLAGISLQAQKIRFMPQWFPQSQFAGYYVALEKGYYAEEGLDVEILHLSNTSSKSIFGYFKAGDVDIITMQLIPVMIEAMKGTDIVNILQTSQNSGLMCVSHTPLQNFAELDGKKVARWSDNTFAEIADAFCKDFNVNVHWCYSLHSKNLFLAHAVDASLVYSYSEYLTLLFSMGEIPQENVLSFSQMGYNFPEDGLYVKFDYFKKHTSEVAKFVKASKKGWLYANEHRDEAVDIVKKYMDSARIPFVREVQKMMLDETLRLQVNPSNHRIDFKPVGPELFDLISNELVDLEYPGKHLNYKEFIYGFE